jgi:hypothetical protein
VTVKTKIAIVGDKGNYFLKKKKHITWSVRLFLYVQEFCLDVELSTLDSANCRTSSVNRKVAAAVVRTTHLLQLLHL